MMRGSIQPSNMLLACVAGLFVLAHARPSEKDIKKGDADNLQRVQDDVQWESQWWTPQDKDTKDSWKVFKTEKPAERRRWWEEDWHEDEWWSPKDSSSSSSSSSNSVSSSKTTLPSAKKMASPSAKKGKAFCKLDEECRKGRMCRNGMCVCLPSDGCSGHYKPVCGSDGAQYPSFCELHRTACVKHVHIKVDYTGKCFMKHANEMEKIQKENYNDHLIPKTSSQSEEDSDDDDNEYEDSDYDEDDYNYDEEDDKKVEEKDEVDEWLKSNTKKVTLDSKKIYDYTQDLKKASAKTSDQDDGDNMVDPSPWDHVEEETGQEFQTKGGKKATAMASSYDDDDDGYQSDGGYKECTKAELAKFKHQLLVFYCKRFQEPDCKLEVKEERDYLTSLMFSYLDMNTDYQLSYEELTTRQKSEEFGDISDICQLTDLIWYDDKLNADGRLSLDEFEQAFNNLDADEKSESPSFAASLSPIVHIVPTLATVGNGLELKCGLAAKGANVVWRRQGVNIRDLANATGELMVLDDGSLFFSKMGVHHMGNYSCEDSADSSILQVHALKVQMPPIVKVSPHSQIHLPKLNAKMKCHAEGVPKPSINWHKNNVPITQETHHYAMEDHDELLLVFNTDSQRDSGAYKCVAKNQAGTSEDVASVVIMKDEKSWGLGYTLPDSGLFMVFHKEGYTVYSPDDCLRTRSVHKDFGFFKFIPDNLDGPLRLCPDDRDCSWGEVVNVKNSFVYASQPDMNRVVVIETAKKWVPLQVIATDKQPMQLHYVEHLDQVWVLCWNGGNDDSSKTIVVIRDASKIVQHRSVHTQPVGNHFDQIQALFIAPPNDLRHVFDYGYVTHNGQQGLTKLDLDNMLYVKAVDLSSYGCVPRSLAFVPIGGHVVVECVSLLNHQTLQVVMDYITDAVVSTAVLSGHPYVSPDSRHVVTVDDLTGKVSVAGVNNEGTLEAAYEVTVSASISDVAFYPAYGEGYLLVLTSADDDDIITINLSTGKVSKLKGAKGAATSSDWHPSPVKRTITTGDIFCNFLMAPSKSSLAIVDMKFHHVSCENTDIPRSQAAVFVGH
ncbi:follistatin-related protein 5-like isoform X2 [Babylonia areolata]|uniref:follistatin-related protein 5-like isoform X2 n=1 Tax=Babylonia areolata TaxID=304850 RepID=UPI003FD1A9BB